MAVCFVRFGVGLCRCNLNRSLMLFGSYYNLTMLGLTLMYPLDHVITLLQIDVCGISTPHQARGSQVIVL